MTCNCTCQSPHIRLNTDNSVISCVMMNDEERNNGRCESLTSKYTGWAKKTGPFLNVDNFAMVSGRKACVMSKVCKFYLEKSIKLA